MADDHHIDQVAARAHAALLARLRAQLVDMSSEITSRDHYTKMDDDELEPIERMIREIDAVVAPTPDPDRTAELPAGWPAVIR